MPMEATPSRRKTRRLSDRRDANLDHERTSSQALEPTGSSDDALPRWVWLAVGLFVAASAVTVRFGRVTLDEGWYLYLAGELLHGRFPYRDFLFTQTPLSLFLFAPLSVLGPASHLGNRVVCAALGIASVLLTIAGARRLAGGAAAALCAALLASNAAYCFDVCSVKTAAPGSFVVALSLYLLARSVSSATANAPGAQAEHPLESPLGSPSSGKESLDHGATAWTLATAVLSIGIFVRLSLAPACLLVWLAGLLCYRHSPLAQLRITLGAVVPSALLLGVCLAWSGRDFWFGTVQYHNLLFGQNATHPTWDTIEIFTRGSFANQGFAMMLGAFSLLSLSRIAADTGWNPLRLSAPLQVATLGFILWGSVTAAHATRTMPYPTYQTTIFPLLAFASGIALAEIFPRRLRLPQALYGLALLTVPFQEWPLRFGSDGSLQGLADTASQIRALDHGDAFLSFDPTLAVASGIPILQGYEMGRFAYIPAVESAASFHARNAADLWRDLSDQRASIVAVDQRNVLDIHATQGEYPILDALNDNYVVAITVARYGQFGNELYIFLPRSKAEESPQR